MSNCSVCIGLMKIEEFRCLRRTLSRQDFRPGIRYLEEILEFQRKVREQVLSAYKSGSLPLTLGGDHSLAIGSLSATCSYFADLGTSV